MYCYLAKSYPNWSLLWPQISTSSDFLISIFSTIIDGFCPTKKKRKKGKEKSFLLQKKKKRIRMALISHGAEYSIYTQCSLDVRTQSNKVFPHQLKQYFGFIYCSDGKSFACWCDVVELFACWLFYFCRLFSLSFAFIQCHFHFTSFSFSFPFIRCRAFVCCWFLLDVTHSTAAPIHLNFNCVSGNGCSSVFFALDFVGSLKNLIITQNIQMS